MAEPAGGVEPKGANVGGPIAIERPLGPMVQKGFALFAAAVMILVVVYQAVVREPGRPGTNPEENVPVLPAHPAAPRHRPSASRLSGRNDILVVPPPLRALPEPLTLPT